MGGRQKERERVCAAMQKLQDGQREAIDLAFFAGMTQSQIAEKLGAPLGTDESADSARLAGVARRTERSFAMNEELEEQASLYVFGLLESGEAAAFEQRVELRR